MPHAYICKCPLYHPFSSKDFPLAFISEDFGGACLSPGLNGLLSPTQFPDIFFICVLKNSNFFYVHVYRIYSFFFERFWSHFKKQWLRLELWKKGWMDDMCISLIFFSNKMKNKNRSVFWHLNPAPPILECKVYASSYSCIPNLQTPCKHLFFFITLMDSMVIWRTSTPLLNRKKLITPFIKLYTSMWRGSSGLCDTEIQIHSISNSGFFIFCLFFVDC